MFTDEIGDKLVEVKKYNEDEPLKMMPNEQPVPQKKESHEDETLNNVENVHYIDEEKPVKTSSVQMRIFGNPNVKKSQSFNHAKRPELKRNPESPNCPSNSPLTSISSSPMCSPELSPRMCAVFHGSKPIEKSQSFCNKMDPISESETSSVVSFNTPSIGVSSTQPLIILTTPVDDKGRFQH